MDNAQAKFLKEFYEWNRSFRFDTSDGGLPSRFISSSNVRRGAPIQFVPHGKKFVRAEPTPSPPAPPPPPPPPVTVNAVKDETPTERSAATTVKAGAASQQRGQRSANQKNTTRGSQVKSSTQVGSAPSTSAAGKQKRSTQKTLENHSTKKSNRIANSII